MGRLKVVLFIALGIISFCGFLLTLLPASIFFALLPQEVRAAKGLIIGHPQGTIWSGYTTIQFRNFPESSVQWQFDEISADDLTPAATYNVGITGPHHDMTAEFTISELQLSMNQLQGSIHANDINQLSAEYGHRFSGELVLKGISLTTDFRCLQSLAGQVYWDGGGILLNVAEPPLSLELPPISGLLDSHDCNLELALENRPDKLMDIQLKPTGWVEVQIYQAMLNLAGLAEPVPAGNELKPVLLFEEKIL